MPGAKILIVEDESITAMEIQVNLEKWGYEVVGTASSGKEAIEIANKTLPDLILTDITLKGNMDGIETVEKISKQRDVPAIYMTAHSDANTFKRAKVTKPAGYVIKPFEETELKFNVELALYNKESQEKEENNADRERLKAVTDFVLSSTPALTSRMRIQDTAGFLKEFARFFQSNMKPRFDEEVDPESEDILQDYVEWIANVFSNMGYKVESHPGEFWIQECFWGTRAIDNKVFCLMCKAMAELSFMWTGIDGQVKHDYRLGLKPPICKFRYKVHGE